MLRSGPVLSPALLSRPALLLLAWTLFYNLEKFALGPHSYVEMGDEADSRLAFIVAWWHWFFEPFRHFWTPDALGGFDTAAAAVDPGIEALFFAVLPGWAAYATHRLACVFLQAYFTFRLLRDGLQVRTGIALAAGMLYPAVTHHYYPDEQLFGALPLILWALHRNWGNAWRQALVFAALGAFYTYFSVYAFTVFTVPVIWAWAIAFYPRDRARWIALIAFSAAYLVLNAPHLYAGILFGGESARSYVKSWVGPFIQGLMLHQGYWAVATLAAAVAACWRLRDGVLVRVTSVTILFLVIGPLVAEALVYLSRLTGIRLLGQIGVRFYDAAPLLIIAVLGTLCDRVALWIADRRTSGRWPVRAPAGAAVALFLAALAVALNTKSRTVWELIHSSTYAFAFENPVLKELAAQKTDPAEPFRVAGFSAFRTNWRLEEAFLWAYGFETAGGFVNVWPMRYRDYWRRLLAPIMAQDRLIEVKMNNRAHLYMNETGFIWAMCGQTPVRDCVLRPADFYNMNLLAYLNVRYVITPVPFDHPGLELLPSQVRDSLLAWEQERVSRRWLATLRGEPALHLPLYVYRFRDAFPRFFLAGSVRSFDTTMAALDAMATADLATLSSTVFLDRETAGAIGPIAPGGAGTVAVTARASDDIRLAVNAPSKAVLATSMSFNRFWEACVNGQPASPVLINHAFLGLAVPAGQYEVRLSYRPPWRPGRLDCAG